jgi:hypothetical protein
MKKEIMNFIKRFQTKETVEVFTCGCCYWFAFILNHRFENSVIMYDTVINHYGTLIDGAVYDITGDVSDKYNWKIWDEVKTIDELWYKRLVRDCINFGKEE